MPGTTPLTSQLALLISTTTTKVEIGSNAVRLRLRSLTWATGQPPSVRVDDEGAMTPAVRPIASLLRQVRERRHCVGFWNLFYYPHLDQWLSFAGGVLIV